MQQSRGSQEHPAHGSSWLSWLQKQPGFAQVPGGAVECRRESQRMESKADSLQARRGQHHGPVSCLCLSCTEKAALRCDSQDGTGHLCNQKIPLALPSCMPRGV